MKKPHANFLTRQRTSHKGDYGSILIIAGSTGMSGAASLCACAALRSGAGRVTVATSRGCQSLVALSRPEIMTIGLGQTPRGTIKRQAARTVARMSKAKADVVALGPGLSMHPQTRLFIRDCVRMLRQPLVIDADGLNALVGHMDVLHRADRVTVITPHPGELSRLVNLPIAAVVKQRVGIARELARRYNILTVVKGCGTVVADPSGRLFRNTTGNAGMATAGSGDVLTGIIAALMAQTDDPFAAVTAAVYIHGLAGDIAAGEKGLTSLIASDIIEALPQAFKRLDGGACNAGVAQR